MPKHNKTRWIPKWAREHYTQHQLDAFAILDLKLDAEHAERQAIDGPYFPDRGITAETLKAYAAECRVKIQEYKVYGADKE